MGNPLTDDGRHPLAAFGWAPGGYMISCKECFDEQGDQLLQIDHLCGAKRAWRCEKHAQEAKDRHDANPPPPPAPKTMDFNVNYTVLVKLKPHGIAELKRKHDDLRRRVPSIPEFEPPKTDEDGYSKFQLWSLMHDLGHLCGLGREAPFETTIKIILDQK